MASKIEALTGLEYVRRVRSYSPRILRAGGEQNRGPHRPRICSAFVVCLQEKKGFDNPPTTTGTHQRLSLMGNPPREFPMGCGSNVSTPRNHKKSPKMGDGNSLGRRHGAVSMYFYRTMWRGIVYRHFRHHVERIIPKFASNPDLFAIKERDTILGRRQTGRGRHRHYLLDKGVRFANNR